MGVTRIVTGKIGCVIHLPKAETALRECRKGKIYWINAKLLFEALKAIYRVCVCNKSTWMFYLHFPNRSHVQTFLAVCQPPYFAGGGPTLPGGGIHDSPAPSSEIPSISTFLLLSAQYLLRPTLSPLSPANRRSLLGVTISVYGLIFWALHFQAKQHYILLLVYLFALFQNLISEMVPCCLHIQPQFFSTNFSDFQGSA